MITLNQIKSTIDKVENDFKFEGGPVDFISDFRTKVAELQDCHYSENGKTSFSGSPMFGISVFGIHGSSVSSMMLGQDEPVDEIAGPQTEALYEQLKEWLTDEGKN